MGLTQVGTGGIKDDAVTSGKILDSEIETSDIKDEAVTLAKLPKGDNNSDGKVLTSNKDAAPTFNTPTVEGVDVKSDGITATSPYKFLRADGDNSCSWQVPAGTDLVTDDANGLVPPHPASNENPTKKFLRGDLTWDEPSLVTTGNNGLVPPLPASTENPTLKFLRGDRSWQELNYTVSGTTTGDEGTDASVSISGNAFSFTIPKGDKGDQGNPGTNATVGVHSTVTGNAGTDASVTNEGTSSAASFKFTIPRGNTGNTGASGRTILNGSGPPTGSTGGNVGDFYIDTTNNNIYGPKESGGWVGSETSLVGPAGSDGKTVLNGTSDPNTEGSAGDFYINTDSNEIFGPKDENNGWGDGTSLVGPSQTGAQIKTAYEGESNTNAFTDSEKLKLNFIDSGATRAGLYTSYARLEDRKAYNVTGGTCIADYQNRDLNTEAYDPDGIVLGLNNISTGTTKSNGSSTYSVATNTDEFALGAGTYVFIISCPAANVVRTFFYLRERDLDDNNTNLNHPSTVEYSNGFYATVRPQMFLRRTISATRKFVIRQFTSSANTNSNALGIPMYGGSGTNPGSSRDNVYSVVEIYKEYT